MHPLQVHTVIFCHTLQDTPDLLRGEKGVGVNPRVFKDSLAGYRGGAQRVLHIRISAS